MADICISTAIIIAFFAWYLIAQRFPIVPQGPKSLRGALGVGLVIYAAYAAVAYANHFTPDSWSTAFVGVAIVLLHVLLAMVVAFMLWTMKKGVLHLGFDQHFDIAGARGMSDLPIIGWIHGMRNVQNGY